MYVVFVALVLVMLVLLVKEHQRANTADKRANERANRTLQGALILAGEQFKKREALIRADAIKRSTAVVKGKVAEQLVPFGPEFDYNPRDARFLGSPIDFVVFDGLSEGDLCKVVFVEVKTGNSRLSRRERQIRDLVKAGEVYWEKIKL